MFSSRGGEEMCSPLEEVRRRCVPSRGGEEEEMCSPLEEVKRSRDVFSSRGGEKIRRCVLL